MSEIQGYRHKRDREQHGPVSVGYPGLTRQDPDTEHDQDKRQRSPEGKGPQDRQFCNFKKRYEGIGRIVEELGWGTVETCLEGVLSAEIIQSVPGTAKHHMGRVIKNAEIEMGIGGLVDDDDDRKNYAQKEDESGIKVYSAVRWRRGSAGELFR